MWVTKDNEIISDAEPDSDGFMEVRRPCPDCLGSGINCLQCAGSGSLPAVMEKYILCTSGLLKTLYRCHLNHLNKHLLKAFLKLF